MALPHYLSQELDRGFDRSEETLALSRVQAAKDQRCQGATFHSPRPLVLIQVPLVPLDWSWGMDCEEVWLCGTCQDNLSVYQALLWEHHGGVPWTVRREVGNMIRALGDKSWALYQSELSKHG